MEKLAFAFVSIFFGLFLFISLNGLERLDAQESATEIAPDEVDNGNTITLHNKTVNYHGNALGYLVSPAPLTNATAISGEQQQKLPAVVLVHEWWGLDGLTKDTADLLARQGYVVFAPDLYNGEVTTDQNRARELSSFVRDNPKQAITNLQSAVQYLASLPYVDSSKIASLGWAFGAGQSLQLALNSKDNPLAATVLYYGQVENDRELLSKIDWPVLGIFGAEDRSLPVQSIYQFGEALNDTGVTNELYIYPGVSHGFANPSYENYAPAETADAWRKTLVFLDKYVSGKDDSGGHETRDTSIDNETLVLVKDVIKDLQANDTSSAGIHLKLVQQQLSLIKENSSSIEQAKVLVNDTIEELENGDINSALLHMNLADQNIAQQQSTVETAVQNPTSLPSDSEELPEPRTTGETQNDRYYDGLNWREICNNPLLSSYITQPCDVLVTTDGNALTSEGKIQLEGILCPRGPSILSTIEIFYGTISDELKNKLGAACGW
jgi:carboxymethylenebutenolidase